MSITFRKRKPRKTVVAAVENHPGRQSFVEFVRHVKPSLTITKQIRLLAQKVEGPLLRGEGWLRLILVWPPRTGKTTAGSVMLLAWIFGLQPEWEAIVGSLSGKLATKIGAKVRQIIGSLARNCYYGQEKKSVEDLQARYTERTMKHEKRLRHGDAGKTVVGALTAPNAETRERRALHAALGQLPPALRSDAEAFLGGKLAKPSAALVLRLRDILDVRMPSVLKTV